MVCEVVDNVDNEVLLGHCTEVGVTIESDSSVTVSDNGRGIPTGIVAEEGRSAAEVIMTVLHKGLGLSVVNALSDRLLLDIYRDGQHHHQQYRLGAPQSPLAVVGPSDLRGTRLRFYPDPAIFKDVQFHYDILAQRLRQWSFRISGVRVVLHEETTGRQDIFEHLVASRSSSNT